MGIIQIQGHSVHPAFLNSKSVVVDLGANHGSFAQEIVERFQCTCFAIEGNSELAATLNGNPRIKVVHALVGDREGMATLSITQNDQCSSVMDAPGSPVIRQEQVRMLSLVSLRSELNLEQIDLLKMDIEGAEVPVLDACPDSLLQKVGQLALEFHDSSGMTSMEEINRITQRLGKLGFHWIRGTFSNFEDNLFINQALCPLSTLDLLYNRTVARYGNGICRVIARWKRRWAST